jgi:two-component system, chemotaxis family, sensor kinase CheA
MMIEDDELRNLYKVSSEEHIQKLEVGILHLEKNPEDQTPFTDLMREAHSLKGDSRMLGVDGVEIISHKIEDILGAIRNKEVSLTADLSDRLYHGLDALRKLVHEAVTGEDSQINLDQFMSYLDGETLDLSEEENLTDSPEISEQIIEEDTFIQLNETPPIINKEDNLQPESSATLIKENIEQFKIYFSQLKDNPKNEESLAKLEEINLSIQQEAKILHIESIIPILDQMQFLIVDLQQKNTTLNDNIKDRIAEGLKGVESIIKEFLTGKTSTINTFHLLAYLMGANSTPEKTDYPDLPPEKEETPTKKLQTPPIATPVDKPPTKTSSPQNNNKPPQKPPFQTSAPPLKHEPKEASASKIGEPYRIDTIRVKTSHLDALMTQTGELTVTKIRIAHTSMEIEEALTVWEEWKNSRRSSTFSQNNSLSEGSQIYEEKLDKIFQHLRNATSENSTRLELIAGELEDKIRTLRLLPLSTVFTLFPRMVRDLAKQEGKEIELIIEGGETSADKQILEEIKDPLMHMIRNAVDHAIETPTERQQKGKHPTGKIHLKGYQTASTIVIEVKDDGRGLDLQKIKETAISKGLYRAEELETMTTNQIYSIILVPGFSTRKFITEVSGRGVGLDVVNTNVERLKGNITIESTLGQGCTFRIQLGTTLATANVLLVNLQNITHAIPIEYVQTTLLIAPEQIFTIEGRDTIALNNQAISVAYLADLLEFSSDFNNDNLSNKEQNKGNLLCILLDIAGEKLGLFVDRLLDTQDVVIKPQSSLLKRVRNVAGATILGTGEVCMILNPLDLLKTVQKKRGASVSIHPNIPAKSNIHLNANVEEKRVVLLAEDSIATRTQEKRILESAGYEVITAVDGLDGFNKLTSRNFDAVISDIQMPNMDGLTFTEKIRKIPKYNELPIILVTSLASDEDKRRGAQAGANAYITKDRFNQEVLIETLNRLV